MVISERTIPAEKQEAASKLLESAKTAGLAAITKLLADIAAVKGNPGARFTIENNEKSPFYTLVKFHDDIYATLSPDETEIVLAQVLSFIQGHADFVRLKAELKNIDASLRLGRSKAIDVVVVIESKEKKAARKAHEKDQKKPNKAPKTPGRPIPGEPILPRAPRIDPTY